MRSVDLKAAARIRGAALERFATYGVAGSSLRAIAADADVSPALILHHFGSKDGLRAAVDDFVVEFVAIVLDGFVEHGAGDDSVALFTRFAEQPAMIEYVSRSIVEGGSPGESLFDRLLELTLTGLDDMQASGLMRSDIDDRPMLAIYLLAADLGVMLLREQVKRHLGVDPMSPEGLRRWARTGMDVLGSGLFTTPPAEEAP